MTNQVYVVDFGLMSKLKVVVELLLRWEQNSQKLGQGIFPFMVLPSAVNVAVIYLFQNLCGQLMAKLLEVKD